MSVRHQAMFMSFSISTQRALHGRVADERSALFYQSHVHLTHYPVMEAHARTANTHITLEFSVQLGEHFSVKLEVGDISVTEHFFV